MNLIHFILTLVDLVSVTCSALPIEIKVRDLLD